MDTAILKLVGFDDKEAQLYLTLLKLGPSPASKVAKELGYDRTTTYYLLLRMLEKGFVNQAIVGRAQTFSALAPGQIHFLLKEREQMFASAVPQLERLSAQREAPIRIEVRQGKEGLHHVYRDALMTGGELLALGVDDAQYVEFDPVHFEQYNKEVERGKIKERLLTVKGAKIFGSKVSKYRFVPKEYFNPTPIVIYGNKVVIITWEPSIHLVYIENAALAQSFRKHFELLWTMADTKP